jgi:AraC-like DNA-binding protein
MFYVIGIIITFFLAFLLISKKGKTHADNVLVAWLIVIGIHLSLFYNLYFNNNSYPYLLGLETPFPLIQGPLLWLYTAALTHQLNLKNHRWLLHFVPFVAVYLYIIPFFNLPAAQKAYVYQHQGIGYEGLMRTMDVLIPLSGFSYVIWTSILLKRHKRHIAQQFSNTERINLNWLQYLIYGVCLIWITTLFGFEEITFGSVVLFILFIGYFGINQVGIFTDTHTFTPPQYKTENKDFDTFVNEPIEEEMLENVELAKKKYQKSGLSEEQAEQVQKDLAHLMATEKLFKNSELALTDLANRLDIHPNYLSQVINEKAGVNFYDYINTLRIEEFKKLTALPESKQYTLLSLAYDCGFNSKSSFNRHFKKITDLSPSEYMRNLS